MINFAINKVLILLIAGMTKTLLARLKSSESKRYSLMKLRWHLIMFRSRKTIVSVHYLRERSDLGPFTTNTTAILRRALVYTNSTIYRRNFYRVDIHDDTERREDEHGVYSPGRSNRDTHYCSVELLHTYVIEL